MSKRFTIEISDQLNAWLIKQAVAGHRSKNKQVEYLLELTKKLFGETTPEQARLDFHHLVDREARDGWIYGRRQGEK